MAKSGSGGNNGAGHGKRMPPPPGGPMAKDLTYAEFHVQRNGQAEVLRLDRGEIVSVDDSSITLSEKDGNQVTISIDASTRVLAGPGGKTAAGVRCRPEQLQRGGVTPCGATLSRLSLPRSGGGHLPPEPS